MWPCGTGWTSSNEKVIQKSTAALTGATRRRSTYLSKPPGEILPFLCAACSTQSVCVRCAWGIQEPAYAVLRTRVQECTESQERREQRERESQERGKSRKCEECARGCTTTIHGDRWAAFPLPSTPRLQPSTHFPSFPFFLNRSRFSVPARQRAVVGRQRILLLFPVLPQPPINLYRRPCDAMLFVEDRAEALYRLHRGCP